MSRPRIAIPVPTSMDLEYNRRAWGQYAVAVERSGGEAVEVPLDAAPAATARLIAECQGVVLPGSGADVNPQKYGQEPVEECAPADAAREAGAGAGWVPAAGGEFEPSSGDWGPRGWAAGGGAELRGWGD
jgi:gamma-glutamyl-gamma-aminobutyrate hydrolase PuuD